VVLVEADAPDVVPRTGPVALEALAHWRALAPGDALRHHCEVLHVMAGQLVWRREAGAAPLLESRLKALCWWRQAAGAGHAEARRRLVQHADGGREALSAGQRAAVQAMAGHSLALAARLELAALFVLRLHECLLLDLRHADAGDFLRVDVSARHGKARRRLVRIETALQRDALERAKRVLLPDGRPVPEDVGGDYAARHRQFKRLCQRNRIGLAAFESLGFRDVVDKIQHFDLPAAPMTAESGLDVPGGAPA